MSRASDVMGANAPVWLSGKVYRPGDLVKAPADRYQLYVRTSAVGSGATDPSADPGNYTPFGARAIKSTQRGVIVFTAGAKTVTATITAVNPAKTQLRFMGSTGVGNGTGSGSDSARVVLTNATTVTGERESGADSSGNTQGAVAWELTEVY